MSVPKVLSSDDIDELAESVTDAKDPLTVATTLVAAVDENRLADPADAAGALVLAAEIYEYMEDLATALALADRAIEAEKRHGEADAGGPRAYRAELLAQLDRDDEAMAELVALRPLLTRDEEAAEYLSAALVALDRLDLAEQWLTKALREVMADVETAGPVGQADHDEDVDPLVAIMFALLGQRHGIRHQLELPHDEFDELAESIDEVAEQIEDKLAHEPLPYWPVSEFEELRRRWPDVAEEYAASWEEHRDSMQTSLVDWVESGHTAPPIVRFNVDALMEYAARAGCDPAAAETHNRYASQLAENGQVVSWPPGRNDECWCGSGTKYKKCCLVRSR